MNDEQRPGEVWRLIQEWLDVKQPYAPSQRKLAGQLGVSSSTLSEWKYGRVLPGPAAVDRLAREIGTPYDTVLDAFLIDNGYRPRPKREPRKAG